MFVENIINFKTNLKTLHFRTNNKDIKKLDNVQVFYSFNAKTDFFDFVFKAWKSSPKVLQSSLLSTYHANKMPEQNLEKTELIFFLYIDETYYNQMIVKGIIIPVTFMIIWFLQTSKTISTVYWIKLLNLI